ncbi:MAG: hypothetical protein ALAOOOJD_03432 [bacterium]|nr:hypothetical protein [bacterium]
MFRVSSFLLLILAPAYGQDWQWVRDDRLINPSGVQSYGSARIDLGDIDGDSWLDLAVLDSVGMRWYRNRGMSSSIVFERRTDWDIVPMPAVTGNAVPTLADLNGDGRADLILPDHQTNSFRYWQNTGNAAGSFWTRADSVLEAIAGSRFISLADLDNDHDLDAMAYLDSKLRIYWNTGDSVSPTWQLDPEAFVLGFYNNQPNNIRFADVDGDQRTDIFVGFDWSLKDALASVGRNKSTSDSLIFNFPSNATPMPDARGITIAVGDVDKDGKLDVLTGVEAPFLYLWSSDFDTLSSSFRQTGSLGFPFGYLESGIAIEVQQNGSGEIILVHPDPPTDVLSGFLKFTRFSRRNSLWLRDPNFSLFVQDDGLSNPTLDRFDWDKDGKLDMALGADKHMRSGAAPTTNLFYFTDDQLQSGFFSQFAPDSLFRDPSLIDINGDGRLDLFMQKSGSYRFYENVGTLSTPNWEERSQWSANLTSMAHYRAEIGDLTRDGLWDIIFGENDGTLSFYRNSGTTLAPQWERDDRVFAQVRLDSAAIPTLADLDFDHDLDLILGDRLGRFYAFRNDFVTSVSSEANEIAVPPTPRLVQIYPNPLHAGTTLAFAVSAPQAVTITVYDPLGREVALLLNEKLASGSYTLKWTPQNLPSGTYFIRIKTEEFIKTMKAILQK